MSHKLTLPIILISFTGILVAALACCIPADAEEKKTLSKEERKEKLEIADLLEELDWYTSFLSEERELINWWSEDLLDTPGDQSEFLEQVKDQSLASYEQLKKSLVANANKMDEKYKTQLGASDEEWVIIRSRMIDMLKVAVKQEMGRVKGLEGGKPNPHILAGQKLFRLVTRNRNAGPDQIKEALKAHYSTLDAEKKEMEKAEQRLREILTVRQEAKLILMGFLL